MQPMGAPRSSGEGTGNVIGAGYWLDGSALPRSEYQSMAFVAPFAVGAMAADSGQQWLDSLWESVDFSESGTDYYGETLKMLSMIALSGNWWSPDQAPCP